jgi:hypothetical protein
MFKKASKSACISTIVVSPKPLPPTPSTNTEEDPDESEPADGDIQMEYCSDYLYSHYRRSTKKLPVRT